jgi:hypothetical protein
MPVEEKIFHTVPVIQGKQANASSGRDYFRKLSAGKLGVSTSL